MSAEQQDSLKGSIFLVPKPRKMYRIKAGDPLLIELGTATSTNNNDVKVSFESEISFINFDEQ